MNRISLSAACLLLLALNCTCQSAEGPPNLIFILADDK